jgi:hypothetical protein
MTAANEIELVRNGRRHAYQITEIGRSVLNWSVKL